METGDDQTTDEADGSAPDDGFEPLLDRLHSERGVDLTGYKRASLRRRVLHRMRALDLGEDFAAYQDYMVAHPGELGPLFDSLLVNVTSFFRDPEAWDYLAQEIVPRIVRAKRPTDLIRVWSAGCATGQEP
ncbi:MAG TPA: CheR family methyltransferase, partial [Kofleriaceae bacterium]|nr:CheR family methyltransferase [Kofleriaceae bacterium]